VFHEQVALKRERGNDMSRSDFSHRSFNEQAKPRPAMMMPRLTRSQMLAILRESGVPESDARCWIEQDWTLSAEPTVDG
jgi:hypothetical protein